MQGAVADMAEGTAEDTVADTPPMSAGAGTRYTLAGADTLRTSAASDTLHASARLDTLHVSAGADTAAGATDTGMDTGDIGKAAGSSFSAPAIPQAINSYGVYQYYPGCY